MTSSVSDITTHLCFCLWLHKLFIEPVCQQIRSKRKRLHNAANRTVSYKPPARSSLAEDLRSCTSRPFPTSSSTSSPSVGCINSKGLCDNSKSPSTRGDRVQLHRRWEFRTPTSDALRGNMKSTRRLNFCSSVQTRTFPIFSPEDRSTVQGEVGSSIAASRPLGPTASGRFPLPQQDCKPRGGKW